MRQRLAGKVLVLKMEILNIVDTETSQSVIEIIFAAALCYGFYSDVRRLQIPNAVSLIVLALFFFNYWLVPSGTLTQHLLAGGIAFALTFGLYVASAMGAGDVKLISALMLWGGVKDGPAFLLIMTLIGGLFAGLLLAVRKSMAVWPSIHSYIPSRRLKAWARRGIFPYGVAICIAGLILMPSFFAAAR
ncbi:MAG: prepilin peptidase [Rhodomicrobium sp.]